MELACRYGVNLLIEKPIALNMDLALNDGETSQGERDQMPGWVHVPVWERPPCGLKNYLQQRPAGERGFMTARYACNSLHSWWWRDKAKSGGQLVEQVIHIIDLTRFFLGEPIKVYSMQDNLFHRSDGEYTSEDTSATVIRFDFRQDGNDLSDQWSHP